jgi:hypothetical protein
LLAGAWFFTPSNLSFFLNSTFFFQIGTFS